MDGALEEGRDRQKKKTEMKLLNREQEVQKQLEENKILEAKYNKR